MWAISYQPSATSYQCAVFSRQFAKVIIPAVANGLHDGYMLQASFDLSYAMIRLAPKSPERGLAYDSFILDPAEKIISNRLGL